LVVEVVVNRIVVAATSLRAQPEPWRGARRRGQVLRVGRRPGM